MKHLRILLLTAVLLALGGADESLYDVLGVRKSASGQDIKRAYKQLAKEWHPDKNRDAGAGERFMKIAEAYETLSDPEKRVQYDNFGTTSAQARQPQGQGHEPFFNHGPFGFNFNFGNGGFESSVDKYRINIRGFETKILPESKTKPYLLYAYSDFCYQCMQVEMLWDRIVQDLETIGMGIGTVQVQLDRSLARKLKVSSVPSIMVVVDGKPQYFYRHISIQNLREFIRGVMPTDMITSVYDKNYQEFLGGWQDNKVRMLFFDDRITPSLRFTLAAFAYRERITAGYVNLNQLGTKDLKARYNIAAHRESLMIFNEEYNTPASHISMKVVSRSAMDEVLEINQFLMLPRLSSQNIFNVLCPALSSMKRKRLCVVLLTKKVLEHSPYIDSFRKYATGHYDSEERVRYSYVYEDTQTPFVRELTLGQGPSNSTLGTLRVAVIWRKDKRSLQYDWLDEGWYPDGPDNHRSRRKLHQLVDWALKSGGILPFALQMREDLNDEYGLNLFHRIVQRVQNWMEKLWDTITSVDEMTIITLASTAVFIFVIGFMMRSLVNIEEERVKSFSPEHKPRTRPRPQGQVDGNARPTVYIHPLCSDNFEDLALNCEPGVRLVVVLLDEPTRHKLLQQFACVVHPYSRSDAFVFAFLQLEQYLSWYRSLLEQTLDNQRDLSNINLKNCNGTVLAVNGPHKYFSMYHAHAEKMRRLAKKDQQKQGGGGSGSSSGRFIGFDDSDSESDAEKDPEAEKLFESDLLAGLGVWMERLCEGSLKRFRVEYWPHMSS